MCKHTNKSGEAHRVTPPPRGTRRHAPRDRGYTKYIILERGAAGA